MYHTFQDRERAEAQRILREQAKSLRQCVTDSTPAKRKYGPDLDFASETKKFSAVRQKLGKEMQGHWVGAMPVKEFLKEFLPPANEPMPDIATDPFTEVPTKGDERLRYRPFVEAIQEWVPHFEAVNTSDKPDTTSDSLLKTDISIYKRMEGKKVPEKTDFSEMELWIEFKNKGVAFKDPPHSESATEREEYRRLAIEHGSFTPSTDRGFDERGQLAHYAGALHSKQFRHFSYSILVEGDDARFLRWEPAGTIVTAGFNYRTSPELMAGFLWRFNHLSPKDRGHDDSVQLARLPSAVDAQVRGRLGMTDEKAPLYRYTLPGLDDKGYAYGPMPRTRNRSLVSRCTRNLPVYWIPNVTSDGASKSSSDSESPREGVADTRIDRNKGEKKGFEKQGMIYMKDTWRFLSDLPRVEIKPEHEIYEILHRHETPNIPEDVAGGDVPGGMTRTQEFLNAPWLCVKPRISPYQHYRLVHGIVGRPLSDFTSTKELVTGVLGGLEAHWCAFNKAEILHRDISAGNIILTDDGKGLLIDWEMARFVNEYVNRRPERTGTWQFMSASLLQNPGKKHELMDDLESFLHVLGWMMLRYVPAADGYDSEDRAMDLGAFDEHLPAKGSFDRGGLRKCWALASGLYPSRHFWPKQPSPIFHLLRRLSKPFKSLYGEPPGDEQPESIDVLDSEHDDILANRSLDILRYDRDMKRLQSSSFFIDTVRMALETNSWPVGDGADLHLPIAVSSERDNRAYRITRNTQGRTGNSQGLSRGSKREGSPTPSRRSKRLRGSSPDRPDS